MLGSKYFVHSVVERYPEEWRELLRADIQGLLHRERRYLLSQLQYLLTQHPGCSVLEGLRSDLDELFLSPDNATAPALRSTQAETPAG